MKRKVILYYEVETENCETTQDAADLAATSLYEHLVGEKTIRAVVSTDSTSENAEAKLIL